MSSAPARRGASGWWVGSVVALALTAACRCSEEPAPPPRPPHYPSWEAFVGAAEVGDLPAARLLAGDLHDDGLRPPGGEEAGLGPLGAAIGFVRFAEDAEELSDAVASAAAACGRCHALASGTGPPRPAWQHATAGRWALWGLLWNDASAPPAADEGPLTTVRRAWTAPLPVDTGPGPGDQERRVARVVASCSACHAGAPSRTHPGR